MARKKALQEALDRVAGVTADMIAAAENPVGLGVDIVALNRMRAVLERSPAFKERVFTAEERAYCDATPNPVSHYACRFAAREAVVKALGTGFFQSGVGYRDVSVRRTPSGRPQVVLTGGAKEAARAQSICEIALSMAFTHDEAVACAIAINETAARAARKLPSPEALRQKEYKANLDVLDGLDEELAATGRIDVAIDDTEETIA